MRYSAKLLNLNVGLVLRFQTYITMSDRAYYSLEIARAELVELQLTEPEFGVS